MEARWKMDTAFPKMQRRKEKCVGFFLEPCPKCLDYSKPPSQNTDFRWSHRFPNSSVREKAVSIAVEMHSKKDATEKHPWLPADQTRLTSLLTCTETEAKTCSTELISSISTSHIVLLEWKFHSNSKSVERNLPRIHLCELTEQISAQKAPLAD